MSDKEDLEKKKKYCLQVERKTAVRLLEIGFNSLQKTPSVIEYYHIPLLLLSTAFERLLKCLICLLKMDVNGNVNIDYRDMKKNGHNLVYLIEMLRNILKDKKNSKVLDELRLSIEDMALKEMIKVLSDFGQGARYYNLDIVLKGQSDYEDPITAWDIIEMKIFGWKGTEYPRSEKLMAGIREEITKTLESFVEVIIKLFIFYGFDDVNKSEYGES